jgi:hypothetical protein
MGVQSLEETVRNRLVNYSWRMRDLDWKIYFGQDIPIRILSLIIRKPWYAKAIIDGSNIMDASCGIDKTRTKTEIQKARKSLPFIIMDLENPPSVWIYDSEGNNYASFISVDEYSIRDHLNFKQTKKMVRDIVFEHHHTEDSQLLAFMIPTSTIGFPKFPGAKLKNISMQKSAYLLPINDFTS